MVNRKNNQVCNIKDVRSGATLISSLIAVSIILIAIIGTSNFRYYSALDARKANAQVEAARIALLLSESWTGIQGDENYNPIIHLGNDLNISKDEGPTKPDGYISLGNYKVELNKSNDVNYQISYYVTMSWKDIQTGLRSLIVTVAWAQRDNGNNSFEGTDKTYTLTSYVML